MRTRTVRTVVIVVACTVATGVGAAAVLSATSPQVSPVPPDPPASATVSPVLASSLALFRRPREAEDTPAASVALSPRAQMLGANRDLARLALTTGDGDRVYLAPGNDAVCFLSSTGRESACSDTQPRALSGPRDAIICSPFLPTDQVEVYGTLADGAHDVLVRFSDGSSSPVKLAGNVFVITAPRRDPLPSNVEWDSADGHHVTGTGVPADAAGSRCAGPAGR